MGKKIKVLRMENGGEYTSNEVEFYRSVRIRREYIVPYNP